MMKGIKRWDISRIRMFIVGVLFAVLLFGSNMQVDAKSDIRLSCRSRIVREGQKFRLSLKGVSPKVKTGKIKWKISDTDVAGIKKKSHNKATIKVWEDGNATVTATYKGKKYKCHIKAVSRDYFDEGGSGVDDSISAKPELSATEIELHYIEDYAVPYIGKNPAYQYEYTFRVRNYSASAVKWSIEGDKQTRDRYRINDSGKIYMFMGNYIDEAYSECTVVATLSDGTRLRAKVKGYDDGTTYIRKKLDEFRDSYILPGMTEYEKMDAVARYVNYEYDYEAYQPDMCQYFITGSGDCMASRVAVEYLCNELGLRAMACPSFDSHGQTVVKADGKVFLVTTGFDGKRPRYYEITEISRETFDKINEGNDINPE